MIRILFALLLTFCAATARAGDLPLELARNAPERHIVLPGDTLWSISARFLKSPWRWPEIWRLNQAEIRNPHRIYPGDVIVLEHDADGTPRLRLLEESPPTRPADDRLAPRVHSESLTQPIPSIPASAINPFLSSPVVVDDATLGNAARIVATQQDRVFLARGDQAYVDNADPAIEKWQIYRKGRPLRDPQTQELLGYEASYVGAARQTNPGKPAVFEILSAREEIGRGDRLLPMLPPPLLNYAPHRPEKNIEGRIVSIHGEGTQGGKFSIVTLNRGTRDAIEVGHVLSLQRQRTVTRREDGKPAEVIRVPDENYGLLFVFRTFERLSYALILQSHGPAAVNDLVRTP